MKILEYLAGNMLGTAVVSYLNFGTILLEFKVLSY